MPVSWQFGLYHHQTHSHVINDPTQAGVSLEIPRKVSRSAGAPCTKTQPDKQSSLLPFPSTAPIGRARLPQHGHHGALILRSFSPSHHRRAMTTSTAPPPPLARPTPQLQAPPTLLPPWPRQTTYLLTGALAGLATVPVDYAYTRLSASTTRPPPRLLPFLRHHAPTLTSRAAIRFWAFDVFRSHLQSPSLSPVPVWLKGGVSGAVGGLAEILLIEGAVRGRRVPTLRELGTQAGRLFLCFGTYTGLAVGLRDERVGLPPRPFWWCWCLGAVAGGFGSGVVAALGGERGRGLWGGGMLKGALVVGE